MKFRFRDEVKILHPFYKDESGWVLAVEDTGFGSEDNPHLRYKVRLNVWNESIDFWFDENKLELISKGSTET